MPWWPPVRYTPLVEEPLFSMAIPVSVLRRVPSRTSTDPLGDWTNTLALAPEAARVSSFALMASVCSARSIRRAAIFAWARVSGLPPMWMAVRVMRGSSVSRYSETVSTTANTPRGCSVSGGRTGASEVPVSPLTLTSNWPPSDLGAPDGLRAIALCGLMLSRCAGVPSVHAAPVPRVGVRRRGR